jgi:transforming growth factor-beta-induced protein
VSISRNIILAIALIATVAFPFATADACDCCGCSSGKPAAKKGKDIVDTAVAAGSFKTLVAAVKAAGLVETLKGDGPFTVFAPADQAFAKLPEGTIKALLADKPKLKSVLTYHVVAGKLAAADVIERSWLKTAQGQSLRVVAAGDEVRIDGARIVMTDIKAADGIIHVIDSVVLPRQDIVDTAAKAGEFKTLLAAAKAAGLVETLKGDGPYTVFAPSDEAFAKLPAGTVEALLKDIPKLKSILTYHVVPGRVLAENVPARATEVATANGKSLKVSRSSEGGVRVNDARVVAADVIAGNGVIHVVDSVLLPR